jgi:hypothetical protein
MVIFFRSFVLTGAPRRGEETARWGFRIPAAEAIREVGGFKPPAAEGEPRGGAASGSLRRRRTTGGGADGGSALQRIEGG